MNDNTQVTEVEVIEIEQPTETEIETEAKIEPTPGQLAAEAEIEHLKELAAEALVRAQGDEVDAAIEQLESGEVETADSDPTIGVDVQPEEAGAGPDAGPEIICEDGLPILMPAEVRSMRDGLGISRPMLIELTGINGYRCWAAEQAHKADEPDVIEWRKIVSVVLRRVDEHGLPAEMQPKKRGRKPGSTTNTQDTTQVEQLTAEVNELNAHLALAIQALTEIGEVKSLKEAKAKAIAVLEILTAEDETDDEVTTEA